MGSADRLTLRGWREHNDYRDVARFRQSSRLDEIKDRNDVRTPGRYIGAANVDDDGEPFKEKWSVS
jgi:type I restriction enzyme M protein